jgi:NAD(P)-dependent dehydrogenase (short-subunit alcohol dehydrogenase family)
MSDRVAIVTGAGRGIGRATAIELAKSSWQVALVSRTIKELKQTRAMCGAGEIFACDITDQEQVDATGDGVLKKFGRVDAIAHCAGAVVMKPLEKTTPDDWRLMIDANLSSVYFLWHRFWPVWKKQGGGVLVNVSSYAARDPFAGLSAYGAAKAGVNLLGLALAREGAEAGVRVHTVAPAATETTMLRQIISEEHVPTEQALEPKDVARVIVQCIDGDMKYTSGEVIYVHK